MTCRHDMTCLGTQHWYGIGFPVRSRHVHAFHCFSLALLECNSRGFTFICSLSMSIRAMSACPHAHVHIYARGHVCCLIFGEHCQRERRLLCVGCHSNTRKETLRQWKLCMMSKWLCICLASIGMSMHFIRSWYFFRCPGMSGFFEACSRLV